MTPLFRREAIEAHRQQWMGEVRLVRPVSLSVLVVLLVAVAVAVGSWLVLGEYTRKAHVRGVLVPDRGWIPNLAANFVLRRFTALPSEPVLFAMPDATTQRAAAWTELASLLARSRSISSRASSSSKLPDPGLRPRRPFLGATASGTDSETSIFGFFSCLPGRVPSV